MSDTGIVMQAERLGRSRWWALIALAASYLAWMGATFEPIHRSVPVLRDVSSDALFNAGLAIYVVAMVWLASVVVRIKRNRGISGILNDELASANSKRAYAWSYFVLFGSLLLLAPAEVFGYIEPRTALLALVTVGAAAPIVGTVWFERGAA